MSRTRKKGGSLELYDDFQALKGAAEDLLACLTVRGDTRSETPIYGIRGPIHEAVEALKAELGKGAR